MKKSIIVILFSTLVLTACHNNEKNDPTINLELANTPYTSEEYELDEDGIGVVVASKIYDTETEDEKGRIVIYVQGEDWHNEVFMAWMECHLINAFCNDKDCLERLLYEVFQLQEDDFLNETLNYFSSFYELDEDFILKRREFEGYDGFIEVTISENKDANIYSKPYILVEQGKQDQIIIESRVYEIGQILPLKDRNKE